MDREKELMGILRKLNNVDKQIVNWKTKFMKRKDAYRVGSFAELLCLTDMRVGFLDMAIREIIKLQKKIC